MCLRVLVELFPPGAVEGTAPRADSCVEMGRHFGRHEKMGVRRPAVDPFRLADFRFAQRTAVRFFGVLLVRSAPGDDRADDDHGRTIGRLLERLIRGP